MEFAYFITNQFGLFALVHEVPRFTRLGEYYVTSHKSRLNIPVGKKIVLLWLLFLFGGRGYFQFVAEFRTAWHNGNFAVLISDIKYSVLAATGSTLIFVIIALLLGLSSDAAKSKKP